MANSGMADYWNGRPADVWVAEAERFDSLLAPFGRRVLMAAALEPRLGKIWLDRTPYSLRTALDVPITRDLHDAVIPGFALHWDANDLVKAIAPRVVVWSDPTDWLHRVVPHLDGFLYRTFDEPDGRFLAELMK